MKLEDKIQSLQEDTKKVLLSTLSVGDVFTLAQNAWADPCNGASLARIYCSGVYANIKFQVVQLEYYGSVDCLTVPPKRVYDFPKKAIYFGQGLPSICFHIGKLDPEVILLK